MTDLLNLDELVGVKRTVTVQGKDYEIADRSVDQMLKSIARAKKVDKQTELGPDDVLKELKEAAHSIIPECPKDVIGSMNMRQLNALLAFASQPDEEVEKLAEDSAKENLAESTEPGKQP